MDKCVGDLCVKSGPSCTKKHSTGYVCTRRAGHTGDHIACGDHGHNYYWWAGEVSATAYEVVCLALSGRWAVVNTEERKIIEFYTTKEEAESLRDQLRGNVT